MKNQIWSTTLVLIGWFFANGMSVGDGVVVLIETDHVRVCTHNGFKGIDWFAIFFNDDIEHCMMADFERFIVLQCKFVPINGRFVIDVLIYFFSALFRVVEVDGNESLFAINGRYINPHFV